MKGTTVDLVVAGDESAAFAAAAEAVRRGDRVLVVVRSRRPRAGTRSGPCRTGEARATVRRNAEVVCVDGVGGVEAVVLRDRGTGRLSAVNTSAFLACDGARVPEDPEPEVGA